LQEKERWRDKADRDLPRDLFEDPTITEFDISEIPITNINIAGDYSLDQLKDYAERIQIEELRQITHGRYRCPEKKCRSM
jgi:hypothetical protein